MSRSASRLRGHAFRPVVDGLESREMLSTGGASHIGIAAVHSLAKGVPTLAQLPTAPSRTATTVPANGDVNPYGVAFVPAGFARGGVLNPGDVLVSNFNASTNLQGTGTTIVRVTPDNQTSVFFQGPQGVGLTTALGVLKRGYVIVGNVPSADGTAATVGQGSLIVLDKNGAQVAEFRNAALLDGPWDLTVYDRGDRALIFVSNVLSGAVTRINVSLPSSGGFRVTSATQIASGYTHRADAAAFELGPTGLVYDPRNDTLYVASTADNAVYAVRNAGGTHRDRGTGRVVYHDQTHLHGPLGLTMAPDGNLIAANGDAINPDPNNTSTLVEFTRQGRFVAQFSLNPNPGGAFGVAVSGGPRHQLAAVNDIDNTVQIWTVRGSSS
jgi:hypothetical protein